jgi:CBS domain-containing protein
MGKAGRGRGGRVRTIVVDEVMTRDVVIAIEDMPFKDLVQLLLDKGISGIPVVDQGGYLTGIVTEADLLRVGGAEGPRSVFVEWLLHPKRLERLEALSGDVRARDVMTRDVVAVAPDTPLPEAVKALLRAGVKRLPVTDAEGRVIGIVSRRDLLRPYLRSDEDIREEIVQDVIWQTLWMTPSMLPVIVRDGVVTIEGQVERRSEREILVELVWRVVGVVGVVDRITQRLDDREIRPPFTRPRHAGEARLPTPREGS